MGRRFFGFGCQQWGQSAAVVLGRVVIFDPITYPGSPIIRPLAHPLPTTPMPLPSSSTPAVQIQQFYDKGLAHASYAVRAGRQVAVIDPGRDPQPTTTLPTSTMPR